MLSGQRPSECDYCWRVEDNVESSFSDRIYKSADTWAKPYLNECKTAAWDADVNPSYVEVNFSNVCNFKCSYCSPHISSQWMEEIEKFGPYPTDDRFNNLDWIRQQNQMPIPNREDNPYVDAFWTWWPELYQYLQHFRITGGEPLLSRNTFQVLDYVIENPNSNLELSVNTNLNPPDDIYDRFLEKIQVIINQKSVKRFKIFTSAEAHGKHCDYIRFGMNYDKWLSNIYKAFEIVPDIEFTVMSTYNILSVYSYRQFLEDILNIKKQFVRYGQTRNPILLDIPYLRYPQHQSLFMATPDMADIVRRQVEFMYQNVENNTDSEYVPGFYQHEADKLNRIYNILVNDIAEDSQQNKNRKNFVKFVDEHDRRRGTDFVKTFPDMYEIYSNWKKLL
jgi:organic radical activating enzyme